NHAIASGLNHEKGPLRVFNWADYVNPKVLKDFQKEYGVKVVVTTFQNEEEAVAKLISGQDFDVWFATVDYLSRAVAGKLIQPLQHSYLGNLNKTVWPSLANPFYDVGSRYSVPYTVYTTGIAWRKDKLKKPPSAFSNPYDSFWLAAPYKGK